MAIALTIDQRNSTAEEDQISTWIPRLNTASSDHLHIGFARTAGDEMQALVKDPDQVVEIALLGVRHEQWWVGIGIGSVEPPLGETAAESRGSAFYNAREAVNRAKGEPYGFAVSADDHEQGRAVAAAITLLAHLVRKRGERQWQAVDLMCAGLSQKKVGERLEVSPQAVSQRLRTAAWQEENEGRWLARWLLASETRLDV